MSDYKLVIVGAGVSGLYAAWRLCIDSQTYQPGDILIIEASDRTGGRLRTWTLDQIDPSLPKDPLVRAELGGMRVLNYNIYVCSLVSKLNLELVPFPADVNENWHYLRGTTLQGADYATQTVYPLPSGEQGWVPGEFVYNPLVKLSSPPIVPASSFPTEDGSITQRDFVNTVVSTAEVNGVAAWKMGFWNTIVGSGAAGVPAGNDISYQGYAFFLEAGAYDTIPSNWNAAVAFPNVLSDFSNSPSYWAISTGYETLPNALAAQLVAKGVTIRLQSPVTALARNPIAGNYQLVVNGTSLVSADQVVLALPPSALETLAEAAPVASSVAPLAPMLSQIRQSVPVPLTKVFLVYDQDWWSDALGAPWPQFTRMTTDMPMRQIYNFGQTTDQASGKTYYLFQAVYSDSLKAGYWAGLIPQEAERQGRDVNADLFAHVEDMAGSSIETGTLRFGTTDSLGDFPLFAAAHAQFGTLVSAIAAGRSAGSAPQPVAPVAGAAMNWGTAPFGGGVNFWNSGVDLLNGERQGAYWDMLSPAKGLYVIGEGYSLYQGWVEGALWSAEDMVQAYFGLAAPAWLDTTPYQGAAGHTPVVAAAEGATAQADAAEEACEPMPA